jgi:hypothetical protein
VSKGGSATTTSQPQIPAWLSNALKPLLAGSASRLNEFAAQGHNVLQGRPYNEGVSNVASGQGAAAGGGAEFWKDPRVMRALARAQGGGEN